jgi:hypothetical protein
MFARMCFILGILFVLACAAAYPLSWGRWGAVSYIGDNWGTEVALVNGRCELLLVWNRPLSIPRGFNCPGWYSRPSSQGDLWRVKIGSKGVSPYSGGEVSFPLWMPALIVVQAVAWSRWRKRRRRLAGFPVQTVQA